MPLLAFPVFYGYCPAEFLDEAVQFFRIMTLISY